MNTAQLTEHYSNIKTPAQVKVFSTLDEIIKQELTALWVNFNDFPEENFYFKHTPSLHLNYEYATDDDTIRVWIGSEGDFNTILHEMIHAYASEYRRISWNKARSLPRKTKTWFHSVWNNWAIHFRGLNEGITEKLARELFSKHLDDIKDKLVPLFWPERIQEMQRYIHDRYEFALKEIKQQQLSEYRRKVKEQRKKYKLDVKEEKENLRNSVGIVRDMLKPWFKLLKPRYQRVQEMTRNLLSPDSETSKAIQRMKLGEEELHLEQSRKWYTLYHLDTAYDDFIEVIELILDCLSLSQSETIAQIWGVRDWLWKELKKAYFLGNTLYLRNWQRIFLTLWVDILREFEDMEKVWAISEANENTTANTIQKLKKLRSSLQQKFALESKK